jgi:hypothetical protein
MTPDNMDAFVARIAGKLREPMAADETFHSRTMAAVRTASREQPAPARKRSWWVRRSVRLSPITAIAMAASLAIIVAGTSFSVARRPIAVAAVDTVHVVRFTLVAPDARGVALVGTFNQWTKDATQLVAGENGTWSVSVPLSAGRHEYAFVVQDATGERWVADTFAARVRDEFGVESSLVSVGSSPTT